MGAKTHILERLAPQREEEEAYWLLAMADLMALLLAFFVVLYAASAISEAKYVEITESLKQVLEGRPKVPAALRSQDPRARMDSAGRGPLKAPAPKAEAIAPTPIARTIPPLPPAATPAPTPLRPPHPHQGTGAGNGRSQAEDYALITDLLRDYIHTNRLESEVSVQPTRRGVELTASGSLLFASGSAELTAQATPLIDLAMATMERFPLTLIVEGHTDDVPIRSTRFPSNWELSAARASRVVRALIERGMGSDRLSASGYADTRPLIHPGDTSIKEQRARNRRAVLVFALPK